MRGAYGGPWKIAVKGRPETVPLSDLLLAVRSRLLRIGSRITVFGMWGGMWGRQKKTTKKRLISGAYIQ